MAEATNAETWARRRRTMQFIGVVCLIASCVAAAENAPAMVAALALLGLAWMLGARLL